MDEREEPKIIGQKYVDMVARFNEIPNDRKHSIQRLKLILFKFEPWYWAHKDELTKDEREYLQSNISKVDKDDEDADNQEEVIDPELYP